MKFLKGFPTFPKPFDLCFPKICARTKLKVISNPAPNLGKDAFICPDELNFNMRLNPGSFNSYKWQDESSLPFFEVVDADEFKVQVWDDFGCTGYDTLILTQKCPTKLFSPSADWIHLFK